MISNLNNNECEVLSCIQPSGDITLGNYLGAIENWSKLQDDYRCIYGIVDLHALVAHNYRPEDLKTNTDQMIIDLLACGIDPDKCTLFVQSLVPEHTELNWILMSQTMFGELSRQAQFKIKSNGKESQSINVGLLNYPVLQAADILIYKSKYVPVGEDQRQHLELSRSIANRFNAKFGEIFNPPELLLSPVPKVMSLADPTRKMSKSLGEKHFVRLFEEENILRKKIKSAVTDDPQTKEGEMSPGVESLFTLLKASADRKVYDSLLDDFNNGNLLNSRLKEALSDALVDMTSELRYNRSKIANDVSLIHDSIREMSARARSIARETLFEVKQMTGLKSNSNF